MKSNLLFYIIIAALIVVIVLQRCNRVKPSTVSTSDTVSVVDTLYIVETDTVHLTAPAIVKTIPGKVPAFMVADTNCDRLKIQHEALTREYFASIIQKDTLRKGKSWLILTDTVTQNRITGRKAVYELETVTVKETNTITNTVTNTIEAKRQFYLGGGISGNKVNLINRFELGVLYKDRKDRMFGVGADMDVTGQVSYGVKSYWKIKLK